MTTNGVHSCQNGGAHPCGHRREEPASGCKHGYDHERERRPRHPRAGLGGGECLHQSREDHPKLYRRGQ